MDITLRVAVVALAVGYLVAAAIRLMAAMAIPWIRKEYLASVPICIGLSAKAFSVLHTGVASTGWSIFGVIVSGAALQMVFIRPAVKAMQVGARPTKVGDGE